MKAKLFKLTAIMLILVGSLASCEKKENEPIEIPFTEYSLEETSGQWKNIESGKVTIINSNEEFKQHFDCSNGNCPEIDFSKNTLLLVGGWTSSSPADVIKIQLQKNYNSEYSLYLEVRQSVLATPGRWTASLIVSKLSYNSIVTLSVDTHL